MDFYSLRDDLEKCKILTTELYVDVEKFVKKPTSKKWCSLIRKKSKSVEKLGDKIKKNIIRQKQDYQGDYS